MAHAYTLPLPLGPFPDFRPDRSPQRPPAQQRRTTAAQGRALEVLGHAIEYLVDSRLFDQWESPADAEAVHLLMRCSRQVFTDCEEVCPWHLRVQRSLMKRLHLQNAAAR